MRHAGRLYKKSNFIHLSFLYLLSYSGRCRYVACAVTTRLQGSFMIPLFLKLMLFILSEKTCESVFTVGFQVDTVGSQSSAVLLTQLHNRHFQQSNLISQTGSHCTVIEAQLYIFHQWLCQVLEQSLETISDPRSFLYQV